MDLPLYGTRSVKEYASFCLFQAHVLLKHTDLALQTGERHLKGFPGGVYFVSVQNQMEQLINQVRDRDEGKEKARLELEKIEKERAEAMEGKRPPHPVRMSRPFSPGRFRGSFAAMWRFLLSCASSRVSSGVLKYAHEY